MRIIQWLGNKCFIQIYNRHRHILTNNTLQEKWLCVFGASERIHSHSNWCVIKENVQLYMYIYIYTHFFLWHEVMPYCLCISIQCSLCRHFLCWWIISFVIHIEEFFLNERNVLAYAYAFMFELVFVPIWACEQNTFVIKPTNS